MNADGLLTADDGGLRSALARGPGSGAKQAAGQAALFFLAGGVVAVTLAGCGDTPRDAYRRYALAVHRLDANAAAAASTGPRDRLYLALGAAEYCVALRELTEAYVAACGEREFRRFAKLAGLDPNLAEVRDELPSPPPEREALAEIRQRARRAQVAVRGDDATLRLADSGEVLHLVRVDGRWLVRLEEDHDDSDGIALRSGAVAYRMLVGKLREVTGRIGGRYATTQRLARSLAGGFTAAAFAAAHDADAERALQEGIAQGKARLMTWFRPGREVRRLRRTSMVLHVEEERMLWGKARRPVTREWLGEHLRGMDLRYRKPSRRRVIVEADEDVTDGRFLRVIEAIHGAGALPIMVCVLEEPVIVEYQAGQKVAEITAIGRAADDAARRRLLNGQPVDVWADVPLSGPGDRTRRERVLASLDTDGAREDDDVDNLFRVCRKLPLPRRQRLRNAMDTCLGELIFVAPRPEAAATTKRAQKKGSGAF